MDLFPNSHSSTLSRPISNHWSLVLDAFEESWGPSPFKFELCWVKENGFWDLIAHWWSESTPSGNKSFILHRKLKFLKCKLKSWRVTSFGSLTEALASILDDISQIDLHEQAGFLSEEDVFIRNNLQEQYRVKTIQEEIQWR